LAFDATGLAFAFEAAAFDGDEAAFAFAGAAFALLLAGAGFVFRGIAALTLRGGAGSAFFGAAVFFVGLALVAGIIAHKNNVDGHDGE
jgi:hypothetical protein